MHSEEELASAFREIDRGEILLAPELQFPLSFDEALTWAVGPRVFLVFRDRAGGRPRGVVFYRNSGGLPDAAAMCHWCHVVRGHGAVKLMSVRSDERRRVGLYLCSDLSCAVQGRLPRIYELAARRLF